MGRFADLLRAPFSFLFARSASVERLTVYILREHDRGRSLAEILEDPYVRNRTTKEERMRLLERPEIVQALGRDAIEHARAAFAAGR